MPPLASQDDAHMQNHAHMQTVVKTRDLAEEAPRRPEEYNCSVTQKSHSYSQNYAILCSQCLWPEFNVQRYTYSYYNII